MHTIQRRESQTSLPGTRRCSLFWECHVLGASWLRCPGFKWMFYILGFAWWYPSQSITALSTASRKSHYWMATSCPGELGMQPQLSGRKASAQFHPQWEGPISKQPPCSRHGPFEPGGNPVWYIFHSPTPILSHFRVESKWRTWQISVEHFNIWFTSTILTSARLWKIASLKKENYLFGCTGLSGDTQDLWCSAEARGIWFPELGEIPGPCIGSMRS